MKAVLQRVNQAEVLVAQERIAAIGRGLLVFVGVDRGDGPEDAAYLSRKIACLRIFEFPAGKMNQAVGDVGGEVLVVPQFTLLADTRRGRRPDFTSAADPEKAQALLVDFCRDLAAAGLNVQQGKFGAHMQVHLQNDGPVTIILDSKDNHPNPC